MDTVALVALVTAILGIVSGIYALLFGQKPIVELLKEFKRKPKKESGEVSPALPAEAQKNGSSQNKPATPAEEAANQRNKIKLREKVEDFWIEEVLKPSIIEPALPEITLIKRPEAVENPWEKIIQSAHRETALPWPAGTKIVEIFDHAKGRLLILGEPGSGKTTALLKLALSLTDRVKQGKTSTVPVVFNLSSWTDIQKPIAEWLVDELSDKYQIPRKIGGVWIEKDELILLLDGLDEVKEERLKACITAINQFGQEHDEAKVVVCCRSLEYEAINVRLWLHQAVLLQPLTFAQIEAYLAETSGQFLNLQELFQKDPGWQEFAHSPLLLSIMAKADKKKLLEEMPKFNSIEARREYLLQAYVEGMFKHGTPEETYPRSETLHWLAWLARKMSTYGQGLFLIEKIQPDWLPPDEFRVYSLGFRVLIGLMVGGSFGLATGFSAGLIFGVNFGLISGLAFGIAWGLIGWLTFERANHWRGTLTVSLAVGMAFGVTGWLALGVGAALLLGALGFLAGSLAFGIGFGVVEKINSLGAPEKVILVEALRWSPTKAIRSVLLWIVFGSLVGLGIGLPVWLAAGQMAGQVYGIATALVYILTFGMAGGLTSGEIETKSFPNQGIWRSRYNGGRVGLVFFGTLALIFGFSFGLTFGPSHGILGGLFVGLVGWVIGWFFFGGLPFMQHYFLRLLLFSKNCMPWDYARFLSYATKRIFLRKVGGGYIFIHRILLDYFAQLSE